MKPRSEKQKAFLEARGKERKKREAEIRKMNYPDQITCRGCSIDNESTMFRKYATTIYVCEHCGYEEDR